MSKDYSRSRLLRAAILPAAGLFAFAGPAGGQNVGTCLNGYGYDNTGFGSGSCQYAYGQGNTYIGVNAGRYTYGGDRNVAIGDSAGGYYSNYASDSVALGTRAQAAKPIR